MTKSSPQSPLTEAQAQFEYTALSPLGSQTAHIRFAGHFQGHDVTWDTHLITLKECYRQAIHTGSVTENEPVTLCQFIEIEEKSPTEMALMIGIDVPVIDAPTVFKSMIMIHNYKRLRIGRHEYGPSRRFP
jgi:hypothetical protein